MPSDEMVSQNPSGLRDLVLEWLTANNCSQNALARGSGVSPASVSRLLKRRPPGAAVLTNLFLHMRDRMLPPDRRMFTKMAGLKSNLLNNFSGDASSPDSRLALGREWYQLGQSAGSLGKWEDARNYLLTAERLLGKGSTEAPMAAMEAAQNLVNLCDYVGALNDLRRVEAEYRGTMDDRTVAFLALRKVWIHFYAAEFDELFRKAESAMATAKVYGYEELNDVRHFVGRAHLEMAAQTQNPTERKLRMRWAESELRYSRGLHARIGSEPQQGFDLLRLAQVKRLEGRFEDARDLRSKAQALFPHGYHGNLHIDLEEAKVAIETGDTIHVVRGRSQRVVEGWAMLRYRRGMADALTVLGSGLEAALKWQEAVRSYVAALLLYPYENSDLGRYCWYQVGALRRYEPRQFRNLVANLENEIVSRKGVFEWLEGVVLRERETSSMVMSRVASLIGNKSRAQLLKEKSPS